MWSVAGLYGHRIKDLGSNGRKYLGSSRLLKKGAGPRHPLYLLDEKSSSCRYYRLL